MCRRISLPIQLQLTILGHNGKDQVLRQKQVNLLKLDMLMHIGIVSKDTI